MDEELKCARGVPPVVRLSLKRERCPRFKLGLTSPDAVYRYLVSEYGCRPQEWVVAVAFDSRMAPLAIIEISSGGLTESSVDQKVLFPSLLLTGSVFFCIAHNHPSGDGQPSQTDIGLAKQMGQAGKLLGIKLVDSLVLTPSGVTSLKMMGYSLE